MSALCKSTCRRHAIAAAALCLLAAGAMLDSRAAAVTDTSWGRTAQSFSGQFTIPESVGRRAGNNLFHSFQLFSVQAGESATFTTTTPTLANVIARVTGNEASLIDGPLRLSAASGSRPDFFLINPNGVTFGAGARVDVPAAFHVSTAHELRFADGSTLAAGRGPDSSLTVAAPAAFGFLGGQAAAPVMLTPNARVNAFVDGRDLDVTAGSITMDRAAMHTETGTLRLVATGAEAVAVPVNVRQAPEATRLGGAITLATSHASTGEGTVAVHAGTLALSAGASINAVPSLFAPGAVDITVRDGLRISDAFIYSHMASEAAPAGPSLRIRSLGTIDLFGDGGGFQTTTQTRSAAGDISVSAATLTIRGQSNIASYTNAPGNAGNVAIDVAGPMQILESGGVYAQAVASFDASNVATVGAGGSVRVNAGALTIDGTNAILNPPGIASDSNFVATAAGSVTVNVAGALVLRNGGNITSSATAHPGFAPFATQRAGSVSVKAQTILMEATPDAFFSTGIFSDSLGSQEPGSLAFGPGGAAGRVDVEARDITMRGGPTGISADTTGPGAGGTVSVKAERLTLDGLDQYASSISSTSIGAGAGGTVQVQVSDVLTLKNGGLIQALAGGSGRGGSVTVQTRAFIAEGSGDGGLTTGILGTSVGSGAAGDLTVQASEQVTLRHGAVISANANAEGRSGAIRVETRDLLIDGQGDARTGIRSRAAFPSSGQVGRIDVVATGDVQLRDAPEALTIKNDALEPDLPALTPQAITLRARNLSMDGAGLVASSSGAAPGNAIDVRVAGALTMRNDARILTSAQDGNGGPIQVAAGRYLRLVDAQIESSVLGVHNGNGGNIRIEAPVLVLDNGAVQANTAAVRASGGDIAIDVRALVPAGNALLAGGSEPIPFEPGVRPGLNVIQAAAPEGLSGNVQITSPALDLAGSLRALDAQVLDVGIIGRDFCNIGAGSSLVRAGRGGLPPTIADALRPLPGR
ncbi:two-partner secretion domain-containing protein [Aquabacterium humicola]|uniref:two-partner secretion domain-containing protein n=1 Tax=Aquabacterium humicola TaxID=3237377 RepID=UPI00254312D9|nr:filamentous hemagglutinin N-terminal domain-containing protein [Rubrivivax pictus]